MSARRDDDVRDLSVRKGASAATSTQRSSSSSSAKNENASFPCACMYVGGVGISIRAESVG